MDNFLLEVGANVRSFRTHKKLSRRVLGEMVGLSGQAIWNIETGRSDPRLANLNRIALALDTDMATLVGGMLTVIPGESPEDAEVRRFLDRVREMVEDHDMQDKERNL